MLKLMGKKTCTIYDVFFGLSKPMHIHCSITFKMFTMNSWKNGSFSNRKLKRNENSTLSFIEFVHKKEKKVQQLSHQLAPASTSLSSILLSART